MLGKREQGAQIYVYICVKPLRCVTFHLMQQNFPGRGDLTNILVWVFDR